MVARRGLIRAAGTIALLGALTLGGFAAVAQEATPEAGEAAMLPRPAHIHSGNCRELGGIVAPLTDLTAAQGQRVGQANRAVLAESSYTNVPLTLDQIVADDHAINVHLSAEQIDQYIACGEIGGMVDANGALIIGLRELNNSGYTGIAFLAPGADGASTDVSVFISNANAGRQGRGGAQGAGGMAATPEAGAEATVEGMEDMTAPTVEAGSTTDMMGTPETENVGG